MKNALAAIGLATVLAVLLSSPTFAQTAPPKTEPAPAPVAPLEVTEPSADIPIDALIEMASTPEERMALLRRCAGPPPRPIPPDIARVEPASEPVSLE